MPEGDEEDDQILQKLEISKQISDLSDKRHVTATRQRLDMFTTEEQEILQVIEPIMLSIRRIMHQSGYNDGDPISADDQTYILDNVFNYHPDKTAKWSTNTAAFRIAVAYTWFCRWPPRGFLLSMP